MKTKEKQFELIEEVHIGNTGKMYLARDNTGKEYYFKPAISKNGTKGKEYRAYIQKAAYEIQRMISPETAVWCDTINIDGMFGAIQERLEIDEDVTEILQSEIPNIKNYQQLVKEYVIDYLLCNYDSHPRNFLIDGNGDLRGIDKEQSFRYINEEGNLDFQFSINFNEMYGEEPSIYQAFFDNIIDRETATGEKISYEEVNEILKACIERIEKISDEEYKKMFLDYAKSKRPNDYELLLEQICERRKLLIEFVKTDKILDIKKEMTKAENKKEIDSVQAVKEAPKILEAQLEIEEEKVQEVLYYKGCKAFKVNSKNGEKYCLIKNKKSQEIIIPFRDEEELIYLLEKLMLNIELQIDKQDGEPIIITEGEAVTVEIEDVESISGIISNIDSLKVNGENIIKTREALKQLVEKVVVSDKRGKVIDLSTTEYGCKVQDCILEYLYGKKITIPKQAEEALKDYKEEGYAEMNQFLRGKTRVRVQHKHYVEQNIANIIELVKIAEKMPTRKFDVILGRKGAGVGKSKEVGAQNTYDSFVSFGTDNGYATTYSDVQYKRRLRNNEAAIPVELLSRQIKQEWRAGSENEILTLPFRYTVMESGKTEYGDSLIVMGKIKKLDIYQILHQRIDELKQYNEELGENADWVSDLHKLVEEKRKEKTTIEVSELTYLDDEPRENSSSEYKLQSLIEASKKSVVFGKLTSLVSTIKSKLMVKGKESQKMEEAQEK